MNDRKRLRHALMTLIEGVAPSDVTVIPVADAETEGDAIRDTRAILVERESINPEPFEVVNPSPGCRQNERYTWAIRFIGGGGGRNPRERADALDDLLDDVQAALSAQRLTGSARVGPLEMVNEPKSVPHPSGASFTQRWTHTKRGELT